MSKITQEEWQEVLEWCGYYDVEQGFPPPMGISELTIDNLFKYGVYGKLTKVYRNWKSLLHDWVDGLTGDMEKDTASLFRILQDVMRNE